jgi:hypothetical protein
MANLYTDRVLKQNPALVTGNAAADTWSRDPAVKEYGDVSFTDALYTLTTGTDEAAADVLYIAKLKAGTALLTHLCKIYCNDPGTAFNITKIGLLAVDGTTADNDDDKYSGAIDLSAGGKFDFADAAAAGALGLYILPRDMWLTATLGTITAPTAGQTIRFALASVAQS